MTDREKLIELLFDVPEVTVYNRAAPKIADYLISNGVTFAKGTDVPSKWNSMEDRFPGIHERVLVWCESKTIEKHVTACTYMGDGKFSRHVRFVTHWMPMPQPPKED